MVRLTNGAWGLVRASLPYNSCVGKALTREQAARKKDQAAAFMNRIGQPDRAAEFESMSVSEYADGKGLRQSQEKEIRGGKRQRHDN